MKSENLAKRLEKLGYKCFYAKWCYWENVLHVEREDGNYPLAVAETVHYQPGSTSLKTDFKLDDVLYAIQSGNFMDMSEFYSIEKQSANG